MKIEVVVTSPKGISVKSVILISTLQDYVANVAKFPGWTVDIRNVI